MRFPFSIIYSLLHLVLFIVKVGEDKDKDSQLKLEVIAALRAELQEKEILLKVCIP